MVLFTYAKLTICLSTTGLESTSAKFYPITKGLSYSFKAQYIIELHSTEFWKIIF